MKTPFSLACLGLLAAAALLARAGAPPTISPIESRITEQGMPLTVAFSVADAETPAGSLVVAAAANITSLLPADGFRLGGSGADRELTIRPAGTQSGVATVTITVRDGDGQSANREFQVTVLPGNTAPEITAIPNQTAKENSAGITTAFFVADQESPFEALRVSANSSNPELVPVGNITIEGDGFRRLVAVKPAADQIGEAVILLTVTDPGGKSSGSGFRLVVVPVNQRPVISAIPDQTMDAAANAVLAIPFTIEDQETPANELELTVASSNTELLPAAGVVPGGSGKFRVLRLTPVPGRTGVSTITLQVRDAANGTAATAFRLTVTGVNPAINRGDFNGDGLPDLILQHREGYLAASFMNGANLFGSSFFDPATPGDANWRLAGTGDFNRDGNPDLLFQHTDGRLAVWHMNGVKLASLSLLDPSRPGQPGWRVASVVDFHGAGAADLLLQHDNGDLALWLMEGTKLKASTLLRPARPGDPAWRLVGSADFDHDGNVDLVFQHADGTLGLWYMRGTRLIEATVLSPAQPGNGWRVAGVNDYNGDGKPDLLFQHTNGDLGIWYLNGVALDHATLLNPANPGPGWQVAGPK